MRGAWIAGPRGISTAVQAASGRTEYFSDDELLARDDRDSWKLGDDVGVGPIELSGRSAETLGLATHVVDGFPGLVATYGLPADIALEEPGWADRLLDALASPGVAWLLLLIGGAGLYIEMHTPGIGLGGFVAMVAFIVEGQPEPAQGGIIHRFESEPLEDSPPQSPARSAGVLSQAPRSAASARPRATASAGPGAGEQPHKQAVTSATSSRFARNGDEFKRRHNRSGQAGQTRSRYFCSWRESRFLLCGH
jgi:hypothetical protein